MQVIRSKKLEKYELTGESKLDVRPPRTCSKQLTETQNYPAKLFIGHTRERAQKFHGPLSRLKTKLSQSNYDY
jgi:hypothetical protein